MDRFVFLKNQLISGEFERRYRTKESEIFFLVRFLYGWFKIGSAHFLFGEMLREASAQGIGLNK